MPNFFSTLKVTLFCFAMSATAAGCVGENAESEPNIDNPDGGISAATAAEIISPRDPASGMPTGKRL